MREDHGMPYLSLEVGLRSAIRLKIPLKMPSAQVLNSGACFLERMRTFRRSTEPIYELGELSVIIIIWIDF